MRLRIGKIVVGASRLDDEHREVPVRVTESDGRQSTVADLVQLLPDHEAGRSELVDELFKVTIAGNDDR